jgi:hypothetical protein
MMNLDHRGEDPLWDKYQFRKAGGRGDFVVLSRSAKEITNHGASRDTSSAIWVLYRNAAAIKKHE